MHKFFIISLAQYDAKALSGLNCLFKNDEQNPHWLFYGCHNGNRIEILSPIDEADCCESVQDVAKKGNECPCSVIEGLEDRIVRFTASLQEAYDIAVSGNNGCGAIWIVNKKMLEGVYEGYYQVEIEKRGGDEMGFNEFAKLVVKSIKNESKVQRLVGTLHGVIPLYLETHGWCLVPFNKKGFMTDLHETLKFNPYKGDVVDLNTLARSLSEVASSQPEEVAAFKVIIRRCTSTSGVGAVN